MHSLSYIRRTASKAWDHVPWTTLVMGEWKIAQGGDSSFIFPPAADPALRCMMYLLKQHKQLEMQFHQFRKDRRAFPLAPGAGSINS